MLRLGVSIEPNQTTFDHLHIISNHLHVDRSLTAAMAELRCKAGMVEAWIAEVFERG